MNSKKRILSILLAAALLAMPLCVQAAGGITGSVASSGNEQGKVTLTLLYRGGVQPVKTATVVGNSGSFLMENVQDGLYTLQASKYNHVTRTYDIAVSGGTLTQDVQLYLRGDVTGDGFVNVGDVSRSYAHVRKTSVLQDDYVLLCADMNQDGDVNMGDVANIYSKARNPGQNVEIPPLPDAPVEDHKDEPVEVGGTLSFEAQVEAGHLACYNLYKVSGTTLVIEDPMAYVIYDGNTYEAEDGKVEVPELYSKDTNTPVSIAIGNRGPEDRTFTVVLNYPVGSQMNPIPLSGNSLSAFCEEGNDQGVYFRFTASKAGSLTVRRPKNVDCDISITSDVVEGGTRSVSFADNPDSQSLSFPMTAGESVLICVVMNPQNGFNYPEATVTTTVRFI